MSREKFVKIFNICFLSMVIVFAVSFYLQAIDGPFSLDYSRYNETSKHWPSDSPSYQNHSYRPSITHAIQRHVEDGFVDINRGLVEFLMLISACLFLPALVVYINLLDCQKNDTRSFRQMFSKSVMFIGVATCIGVLPSVFLGSFGCGGEWCIPTFIQILLIAILTVPFALLSTLLSRRFKLTYVVVVFVITIASLFFVSLKLHSCDLLFVGRDRYGCLGIKAGHTKDITLCEDPEVVARDVENDCYRAASSKWGNIDLCRRMNIKDVNLLLSRQGQCVRNVAVLTNDIEVCNEFPEDLVGGSDGRNPFYERQSCKRDAQVVIDKGYSSYSQYLSGEN